MSDKTSPQPSSSKMPEKKSKLGLKARRGILLPPLNFDENAQMITPNMFDMEPLSPSTPAPMTKKFLPMEKTSAVVVAAAAAAAKTATTAATSNKSLVAKKRKYMDFPYNEDLLHKKFSVYDLEHVDFNDNKIERKGDPDFIDFTFQYLKKNFLLKINDGKAVSCFWTDSGALAMFDVRQDDLEVLNNLHNFLLCKKNVNPNKNFALLYKNNDALFIRGDRLTTFWNEEGGRLYELPRTAFTANVAIRVIGLQYHKMKALDGMEMDLYEVKPLIHLAQVRVLSESTGEEEFCMFTN